MKKKQEPTPNPLIGVPEQDIAVLRDWQMKYVKKFEATRLLAMSEQERTQWQKTPERQRLGTVMRFLWPRGPGGGIRPLKLPDDLNQLRDSLSPDTQRLLEGKADEDQWKIIQNWLVEIRRQQFPDRMTRRPGLLVVDEKDMADFFEHLDDSQKASLLDDPPDEMLCKLQRMYWSKNSSMARFLHSEAPPDGQRGPFGPRDRRLPNRPEKTEDKPPQEPAQKS